MLKKLVAAALNFRIYLIIGALILSGYGLITAHKLPIDVFPDMNRPNVTILSEVHGYAPEEIEKLVTFHIESAMNGAPGVVRVRSISSVGLSMVMVEFDWGLDVYKCRQIVQERLQMAQEKLPEGITPTLAPASSVTGEIIRIALTSDGKVTPVELRSFADWEIRPRLLTVQGVAQVFTIGGEAREYQILVDSAAMARYSVSINDLEETLRGATLNTPGGFIFREGTELLIRNIGRPEQIAEIKDLVIKTGGHGSVRLNDIADIVEGKKIPRGTAGLNEQDAVIINVLKQPEANTLVLTQKLDEEIQAIKKSLPKGMTLNDQVYRQARFIEVAVHNVIEAVRDGSILVIIIILVFLMNLRMSFIILTSIPLSVISTLIVFSWFGLSVNTMTLGGIAVAVGELVDSAIVGAENIYRRLRENSSRPPEEQKPLFNLLSDATAEVFGGIVLGTLIALLVVFPLFALPGIVGKIFSPIGIAYLVSNFTSMLVSITVTPVLCSYFLKGRLPEYGRDGFVVRGLKRMIEPVVLSSVRFPLVVLLVGGLLAGWALWKATRVGLDLLPEFNEGSVFVIVMSPPGTDLATSSRLAKATAVAMQSVPEIAESVTGHRSGRSEGDEHAHAISQSDVETEIVTPEGKKPRTLDEIQDDVRAAIGRVPGAITELSQPISHLISHLIGGARSEVIVKIYGPDLDVLQEIGNRFHETIRTVPGVVDDYVEQQMLIPQIRIVPNDLELSRYGLHKGDVLKALEIALQGEVLSQVQSGERYFDLTLRGGDSLRETEESISNYLLTTPSGSQIPLKAVADIVEDVGPNVINHENARRRLYVLCNVSGRDLGSTVEEITSKLSQEKLPEGYSWVMGGQYEQLLESGRVMTLLFLITLLLMFAVLAAEFRSMPLAVIIMLNIPQAVIGAVIALIVTGTSLNMGAVVGFVALSGIAARNGILLISHWVTLIGEEGHPFSAETLLLGCKERLTPVLMTALTTTLGLIPLVLAKGQTGKEILYPVAVVIFGGLISSTLLDFTVTPAAARLYGRKGILRLAGKEEA